MLSRAVDSQSGAHVAIFLSTYNGSQFIREQLDSLLQQTHQNFKVYIRDDGSTDDTLHIIERYIQKAPDKFELQLDEKGNLEPSASFSALMESFLASAYSADYFMFCDQDDVWSSEKISCSLAAIEQCSENITQPVLVHTELEVVDDTLQTIAPSLSQYQGLRPGCQRFGRSLINSSVTGCTMLFNKALLERSAPIPQDAVMHDWWVAVVAQTFGRVIYLDQPLIKYRQHGKNTLGAKQQTSPRLEMSFFKKLQFLIFSLHDLRYVTRQARALLLAHGHEMSIFQRFVTRLSLCLDIPIGLIQKIIYRLIRVL